jgi:hypothetical protein
VPLFWTSDAIHFGTVVLTSDVRAVSILAFGASAVGAEAMVAFCRLQRLPHFTPSLLFFPELCVSVALALFPPCVLISLNIVIVGPMGVVAVNAIVGLGNVGFSNGCDHVQAFRRKEGRR